MRQHLGEEGSLAQGEIQGTGGRAASQNMTEANSSELWLYHWAFSKATKKKHCRHHCSAPNMRKVLATISQN